MIVLKLTIRGLVFSFSKMQPLGTFTANFYIALTLTRPLIDMSRLIIPRQNTTQPVISTRPSSGLTPEAIIALVFGITTFLTALISLWQNRRQFINISWGVWHARYSGMFCGAIHLTRSQYQKGELTESKK